MNPAELIRQIFNIQSEDEFNAHSLAVFQFQYQNNTIYRAFCQALNIEPHHPKHYTEIPFLPINFFKQHTIMSCPKEPELVFTSSGTTGMETSSHYVFKPDIYKESFTRCFQLFFGDPADFHILALLPGYMERKGSSLIYMTHELIKQSKSAHSGFYLDELRALQLKIEALQNDSRKILLLGVSFALLDMAEKYPVQHSRLIVMETGGMKGRRKELVREELHRILMGGFGIDAIHSEYGMTELLSQAYSKGNGIFNTPPWMRVLIREANDPLSISPVGFTGGINVIDLANIYSCSFLATQDLGKLNSNGQFEISGRFDNSDIRGCNLLVP